MHLGLGHSRVHLLRHVRRLSSMVKSYPNYVERQCELRLNTTAADDTIEINRETSVQVTKPSSYINITTNYVDTNPLGDKKQPIVLLVHGYPGSHESTRNLIEQFQRRDFRCIAPDMPCSFARSGSYPHGHRVVSFRLREDEGVALEHRPMAKLDLPTCEISRRITQARDGRKTDVRLIFPARAIRMDASLLDLCTR